MARLREDARFKAVQPDAFEADGEAVEADDADEGLELWFDWAFVDFWKNHYCEWGVVRWANDRYDSEEYCY